MLTCLLIFLMWTGVHDDGGEMPTCLHILLMPTFVNRCARWWRRDANLLAYIFDVNRCAWWWRRDANLLAFWRPPLWTGVHDDGGEMLTCLLIFLMPTSVNRCARWWRRGVSLLDAWRSCATSARNTTAGTAQHSSSGSAAKGVSFVNSYYRNL